MITLIKQSKCLKGDKKMNFKILQLILVGFLELSAKG